MMASLNSYVLYIHIKELKYYNHPNIFSISLPGWRGGYIIRWEWYLTAAGDTVEPFGRLHVHIMMKVDDISDFGRGLIVMAQLARKEYLQNSSGICELLLWVSMKRRWIVGRPEVEDTVWESMYHEQKGCLWFPPFDETKSAATSDSVDSQMQCMPKCIEAENEIDNVVYGTL